MPRAYPLRSVTRALSAILFLFAVAGPLNAQRGALTRTRNLGELVGQSAVVLRGHVVSARVEPHPELTHLWTVVVTLRVEEALKGRVNSTFTFRQFIWDIRDRYDAAGYKKGQELLLLMNRPTRYGLSSPAGLEQGRFRILRDGDGRERAVNGHGNAGLWRDLDRELARKRIELSPQLAALVKQHPSGPIPLDSLRDLIRQIGAVSLK
jgi:hypothetical protein